MRSMVNPPPKAPSKLEETVDIAEWPPSQTKTALLQDMEAVKRDMAAEMAAAR
jgi:hypothetical protein